MNNSNLITPVRFLTQLSDFMRTEIGLNPEYVESYISTLYLDMTSMLLEKTSQGIQKDVLDKIMENFEYEKAFELLEGLTNDPKVQKEINLYMRRDFFPSVLEDVTDIIASKAGDTSEIQKKFLLLFESV